MRFTVTIREVHSSYRTVEANSWREAVEKAKANDCEGEYTEYSHTLDSLPIDIVPASPFVKGHDTCDYNSEPEEEKDRKR
jgi:hypothetical protein